MLVFFFFYIFKPYSQKLDWTAEHTAYAEHREMRRRRVPICVKADLCQQLRYDDSGGGSSDDQDAAGRFTAQSVSLLTLSFQRETGRGR